MAKNEKVYLKNAEMYYNPKAFMHYIKLTYEVEDEASIREITYDQIPLDISFNALPIIRQRCSSVYDDCDNCIKLSQTGDFIKGNFITITEKIIKEKTHEMTLDEIEKKLGYKIKIVNGKDGKK